MLTMRNLEKCFEDAIETDAYLVGVLVQMQGFESPEIIINESENFKSKLAYYQKAYNEDLTLKTFNGIKIICFTYGDTFDDVGRDLILNQIKNKISKERR